MPGKNARRQELGAFLRSRRERLKPEDLGIDTYGRRRTPGLRREEICNRGRLGLSWYTWLEQGREVIISADTLLDLACALNLNEDDTTYAFELAELQPPRRTERITLEAPNHLQDMLDCIQLAPAFILNGRWDRIAWNRLAVLALNSFANDTLKFRNNIWKAFVDPRVRETVYGWDSIAPQMAAEFYACRSRYLHEPWMESFIQELTNSSTEFAECLERRDVTYERNRRVTLRHSNGDDLTFFQSSFQVASPADLTLVILTPDAATLETLRKMIARDGQDVAGEIGSLCNADIG